MTLLCDKSARPTCSNRFGSGLNFPHSRWRVIDRKTQLRIAKLVLRSLVMCNVIDRSLLMERPRSRTSLNSKPFMLRQCGKLLLQNHEGTVEFCNSIQICNSREKLSPKGCFQNRNKIIYRRPWTILLDDSNCHLPIAENWVEDRSRNIFYCVKRRTA